MFNNLSDSFFKDIDLTNMKKIDVKVILLGDGMSGKTQLLITFGKIIINYLKDLNQQCSGISGKSEEKTRENEFSPRFYRWAKKCGFIIEYGDDLWDLNSISFDTETIGLEDFQFIFPYKYKDSIYKIRLIGNDLGGQNIFDHFRNVLGKIALPGDNIIIVFDKSRKLSCYNSIQHIKEVTGEVPQDKWKSNRNLLNFWFVGNKIDLEGHIQTQQWRKQISRSLLKKIHTSSEYSLPSLIHPEKEEHILSYEIMNNKISFPDMEALIYNSIRISDNSYGSNLMSDVNTKALAREIASQMIYLQKSRSSEATIIDHQGDWWKDFSNRIFKQRPLALQYARTTGIFQENTPVDDLYEEIRFSWIDHCLNLPLSPEMIENAILKTGEANEIIMSMGEYFSTNAIQGTGVSKLFIAIIQKNIQDEISKDLKKETEPSRRKIQRF